LLVASRESVSADALVDAGAILGMSASSARSTFASVASVKDAAGAYAADGCRDADAIGRAESRVSWAALEDARSRAARLATPRVSTISATAFISLDARGPRVAAALRATPSAPRASCASAEARSDIARGGGSASRAPTRLEREGDDSACRRRNATSRHVFGKFVAEKRHMYHSRRSSLLHPPAFVPPASPSYGLSLWHGTFGTSTSCAVLHSALHPNVSASSFSIAGGVLPK
jgi:hypothetical protein